MTSPPQHPPGPVGQGDKYQMVRLLLKGETSLSVEDWIRAGRSKQSEGNSYYALADKLNAMLRKVYGDSGEAPRVTFESIRRWDPDGEFQRSARERAAETPDNPGGPPPGVGAPVAPEFREAG